MPLIYLKPFSPISVSSVLVAEKTVLLLEMEGIQDGAVFLDTSSSNMGISRNGSVVTKTGVGRNGQSCAYFPYGSSLFWSNSQELAIGANDFTIEFWINPDQNDVNGQAIADFRPNRTNGEFFSIFEVNGAISVTTASVERIRAGSIPSGTWTHVAVSRIQGISRLFINGISVGQWEDSVHYYQGSNTLGIHAFAVYGGRHYQGYLDDFRIINNYGRYLENFIPE